MCVPNYHPWRAWLLSPPHLAPGLLAFAPYSTALGTWGLALLSVWNALPLAFAELASSHASSLKCLNVTLNVRETFSWTFHLKWVFLAFFLSLHSVQFLNCTYHNQHFDYWLIWGFSASLMGMQGSWGQGPHLFTDVSSTQRAVLGMKQGSIFMCLINECMNEQMNNCRIPLQTLLSDLYLLYLPKEMVWPSHFWMYQWQGTKRKAALIIGEWCLQVEMVAEVPNAVLHACCCVVCQPPPAESYVFPSLR